MVASLLSVTDLPRTSMSITSRRRAAVVAGGAIGAGLRHLVNIGAIRLLGIGFPWGTLTVNIAGSFLMGLLIEALALRYSGSLELRAFLATGLLGGLTTFSAFSLDFAIQLQRGDHVVDADLNTKVCGLLLQQCHAAYHVRCGHGGAVPGGEAGAGDG